MQQVPIGQVPTQPQPAPKKRFPRWAKILIGVVVFIVIVIIVAFSATSGVVKVVDKQLSLLKQGDVEGAYALTSGEFKNATPLEDFKKFVEQYPTMSKNKSYTFTERSIENNIGTAKGSLTAEDGTVTPITYTLVKEEGEWKILNLKLGTEE